MLKLIRIFRKLGSAENKENTYLLVRAGLTGFIMIFIINAAIGIYSITMLSHNLKKNIDTINTARSIQLEMQDQFLSWQNILISGNRFSEFQLNYHKFSYHSQIVQNLLFNLKLENYEDADITMRINMLGIMHKEITDNFTKHIVDMEENQFRNTDEKISKTRGRDEEIITVLGNIVLRIEEKCDSDISSGIYISISASVIAFLFFITLTFFYGRETAKRIISTHNTLEDMVEERTEKYLRANQSLQDEIEEHKITEKKMIEARDNLEEKNRLLEMSEKRYRVIFEETRDIFFTLDHQWNFINANKSVKDILKITPDDILRYKLTDLISGSRVHDSVSEQIIIEKIENAREQGAPISFTGFFKTPRLIEPVQLKVYLEFIQTDGHFEIIGKSSPVSEDKTTEFIVSEKSEYNIGNQLFTAEEMSHKITKNLIRYLDKGERNMIRLGLREVLINAIEHGNLDISFEEKSQALLEERYFEFINSRQEEEKYRDKKVRIDYMITPHKAVYKITDQGRGFNHRKIFAQSAEQTNEEMLMHGRGIMMARSIFDKMAYNRKGNQVLLVKNFIEREERQG